MKTAYEKRMEKRWENRQAAKMASIKNPAPNKPKVRRRSDKTREELFCTHCSRYVQFEIDRSLEGRHEFTCPQCGHIHYRVVRNGKITEERWGTDMRGMMTFGATVIGTTSYSVYTDTGSTAFSSYNDTGTTSTTGFDGYYFTS